MMRRMAAMNALRVAVTAEGFVPGQSAPVKVREMPRATYQNDYAQYQQPAAQPNYYDSAAAAAAAAALS